MIIATPKCPYYAQIQSHLGFMVMAIPAVMVDSFNTELNFLDVERKMKSVV